MYVLTFITDKLDDIKSTSLYGGYFVLWYIIVKFLNILKFTLPDALFYLVFSYFSIRIYEVCNNEKSITLSDKLNCFVVDCSYDVILWYSKGQILLGKICKNVSKLTESFNNNYIKDTKIEEIIFCLLNSGPQKEIIGNNIIYDFVKNGDVINSTVSLKDNLIDEDKYDFVLLSFSNYKKIIQKKDVSVNLDNKSIVPSNVKFMVFQLNIPFFNKYDNESLFDLLLQNVDYNFYVDGNRIDKDFLLFFLNNYYSKEIMNIQHLNGCEVRLLDKNVNFISINLDKQFINLYENDYEIKEIVDEEKKLTESDDDYEFTKIEYSEIMNEEKMEECIEEELTKEIVTNEINVLEKEVIEEVREDIEKEVEEIEEVEEVTEEEVVGEKVIEKENKEESME